MEDDVMHDLVAGYALDALDENERRAFEAHLATCEHCREELDALAASTLALAFGAPPAAPPAELRGRLLTAARAGRESVIPLRPRWAYPALATAVAASAAAVALGIWAVSEKAGSGGAQEALTTLSLHGAAGSLVLSDSGNGALVVSGLPAPPAGKTYEAWVLVGKTARPAGLFAPRAGGVAVLRLTRTVPAGAEVAVTLERSGGVPQPTSEPLLTSAPA